MSRLIDGLDAAIAACRDPAQADCLRAERAAAQARSGHLAEARFALKGLRVLTQRRGREALGAWVPFLAGMIEHFEALSPQAFTHFDDARQRAAAVGLPRLQALSLAWMALCHFNARRFAPMVDAMVAAGRLDTERDPGVQARLCLVRADASRLAGLHERAQRLYLNVRHWAMSQGDTAMLSAMAHNRNSGQVDRLGLLDALGERREDEARRALLEADSCSQLDLGLGNEGLGAMPPVMKARLYTVLQRWGEAVALYDAALDEAAGSGMAGLVPHMGLNRAWCRWHLGERQRAEQEARALAPLVDQQPDADDRAAGHARLAALLARCGDSAASAHHQALAQAALEEFQAFQAALAAQLAQVDAVLGD
ncbi:hypothetical protein KAK07_22255 [Ideonella sp. 4Y16]|uniref:Tetratricopeptide repeat protein n=1 Tax=Ideonella alba TaxID=2824118 RepID=A0A940Y592_9BURK|nr:hypothetical protein [Ideonella alba]MBQ0930022.1 hypothetical protein [Ideonella alba]MBQ0946082.1 hypothetical protein [Ideonella alba]